MSRVESVKNCLIIQLVLIVICIQYCQSSSIYVGRHASGTRLEPQEAYKECQDFNTRKCQKIINWYGNDVCSPEKSPWARSLIRICPGSCGLCDCKDNLGRYCLTLSQYCNSESETGKFLQKHCQKTCNTCDQSSARNSELEMVGL